MTCHAEDALRRPRIPEVVDLPSTITTLEAIRAESLISRQYCQVFNLLVASVATVCAVVADEGAISQQQEVRIRIEESSACVTSKAIDVPSVTSYMMYKYMLYDMVCCRRRER